MSEEEVKRSFTRDQIRELALEAIHAQRAALLQARDEGIFSSAALEGALARLDNEESSWSPAAAPNTESRSRARQTGPYPRRGGPAGGEAETRPQSVVTRDA